MSKPHTHQTPKPGLYRHRKLGKPINRIAQIRICRPGGPFAGTLIAIFHVPDHAGFVWNPPYEVAPPWDMWVRPTGQRKFTLVEQRRAA